MAKLLRREIITEVYDGIVDSSPKEKKGCLFYLLIGITILILAFFIGIINGESPQNSSYSEKEIPTENEQNSKNATIQKDNDIIVENNYDSIVELILTIPDEHTERQSDNNISEDSLNIPKDYNENNESSIKKKKFRIRKNRKK